MRSYEALSSACRWGRKHRRSWLSAGASSSHSRAASVLENSGRGFEPFPPPATGGTPRVLRACPGGRWVQL